MEKNLKRKIINLDDSEEPVKKKNKLSIKEDIKTRNIYTYINRLIMIAKCNDIDKGLKLIKNKNHEVTIQITNFGQMLLEIICEIYGFYVSDEVCVLKYKEAFLQALSTSGLELIIDDIELLVEKEYVDSLEICVGDRQLAKGLIINNCIDLDYINEFELCKIIKIIKPKISYKQLTFLMSELNSDKSNEILIYSIGDFFELFGTFKNLERNLTDLILHCKNWYHGRLCSKVADKLLINEGDFLVRYKENTNIISYKFDKKIFHTEILLNSVTGEFYINENANNFQTISSLLENNKLILRNGIKCEKYQKM